MSKNNEEYSCINSEKYGDCFACKDGKCTCLDTTALDGRTCPFYKTREQAQRGRTISLVKLLLKGRFDLIRKYNSFDLVEKEGDTDG